MAQCQSCGDSTIKEIDERSPRKLTADESRTWTSHCYECAMELLFNRVVNCEPIKPSPRMMYDDHASCDGYMTDEASQWQENAIRDMEG